MDEPPLKRQRRTDSAAMWEKSERNERGTASPRLHDSDRDSRPRKHEGGYGGRRDEDRRRRSRSPRDRHDKRRSRSRSPRDRSYRDRDRDRVKEEGGGGGAGRRDRDRSGSRDRDRDRDRRKDHRSDRRHGRSRSPRRNGEPATASSTRARSPAPAPSRVKHEYRDPKAEPREKDVKTGTNGAVKNEMEVDEAEDETDAAMKRMMGFSTFKSTQNTKVPGNQIYGVRKEKKTEYRQYMNRVGGFNRPLSPGR